MSGKDQGNTEGTRVYPKQGDVSEEPQKTARLKRQRIAALVLGAASIVLIAFSAFLIVRDGGLDGLLQTTAVEQGSASAKTSASNKSKDSDASVKTAEDGAQGEEAASADKDAGNTSADGSTDAKQDASSAASDTTSNGGASSGSAAVAGGAAGGSSSAQKPATVTVSITVDASAAGGGTLASTTLTFNQGATVYDALCGCGVSVNARNSQFGVYVAGIGGYAEKEHGDMSGWTYYVNGVFADRSCAAWTLKDGDSISWVYVTG